MQRGQKGFGVRNLSPYRTLVAAAAAIPAAAFAHAGHDAGHDLVQGFMHPLGGLDHVLAMIAVSMVAVFAIFHGYSHGLRSGWAS